MCCDRIVQFVELSIAHVHKRTIIQGLPLVGVHRRPSALTGYTFAGSCMSELFVPRVPTRRAQKQEKICELRARIVMFAATPQLLPRVFSVSK